MSRILKYNEVKFQLIRLIHALDLKAGDKLPPERELVDRFQVSLITVRRAVDDLVAAGNVERRHGVGTIYLGNIAYCGQPSVVGLINVADRHYPNGNVLSELYQILFRHRAQLRLFYTEPAIDGNLAEALAECDRYLITGFVSQSWLDFLTMQGKPVIQLGRSPEALPRPVSRVECDWAAGVRLLVRDLRARGFRRPAFLLGDPNHVTNVRYLRELVETECAAAGFDNSYELIRCIPWEEHERTLAATLTELRGKFDILNLESSNFQDYLYAIWRGDIQVAEHLPLTLLSEHTLLPSELAIPGFCRQLHFGTESVLTVGSKCLFEQPQRFFEQHETWWLTPHLT